MQKIRYGVNGKNLLVRAAAILMVMSAVFRILGCWGPMWKNESTFFTITQVALPIFCNLLFVVIVLKLGEKHFTLTLIPVLLGVVFFIIKATDMKMLSMLLCMAMSLLTAVVYTTTLLGGLQNKWLLIPVFGLPLLYQLIFRDAATILVKENAMTMEEFIPELSVLCILLAMLLTSLAMKKRELEDPDAIEGEIVSVEEPDESQKKLPEKTEETENPIEIENSQEEK